jgi:hypothetical protein
VTATLRLRNKATGARCESEQVWLGYCTLKQRRKARSRLIGRGCDDQHRADGEGSRPTVDVTLGSRSTKEAECNVIG